ncbi:MAG TPA: GNAT family protein [Gemmatimonadales bacterium]|nr:GNAT family protein [Gemmatimonadales bacterium]
MFPWQLDPDTQLRPLSTADAGTFHALVVANRRHLDRFLRWSATVKTLGDARTFLEGFTARLTAGDGWHLGIWVNGALAGGLVCWYINRYSRNAELGYWLAESYVGRGLVTRAAARGIEHLFQIEGLHRIEMLCGVENHASRRVAERLGFQFEGIRRQSAWITDHFADHAVYGLLRPEWKPLPSP